jgi:hypothetical protein
MKKLLLIPFLFIFLFLNAQQNQNVTDSEKNKGVKADFKKFGDNNNGTSMFPIMGDALTVIKYVEDTLKAEIVRIEYDLLYKSKDTFRELFKSANYGICVVGDYRIKKMDIKIYKEKNGEWVFLKQNDESSNIVLLTVKPDEDASYRFELIAKEYKEGFQAGHYCAIIFH